jgi:predicted Zn-dependent protease
MILDSNAPNAFSTPGGHIFLSRGLVDAASSEDMLAAIIAHELAHVQLLHGLAGIKHERLVNDLNREQTRIARMTEREILAEQRQAFSESVNEIANKLFSNGYSRLQEFEADSAAISLLALSGYHPNGLVEILRIMEKTQGNGDGFTGSHPYVTQRIASAEQKAGSYRIPDTRPARKSRFDLIISGGY